LYSLEIGKLLKGICGLVGSLNPPDSASIICRYLS